MGKGLAVLALGLVLGGCAAGSMDRAMRSIGFTPVRSDAEKGHPEQELGQDVLQLLKSLKDLR